ncbi:MAG: 30S ribosomal protein S20 [Candidatus Methylacidiphilales bacterium]|nr:30S ribosomal protein S20 [Candidatus Methylacidiphilales bacterium]
MANTRSAAKQARVSKRRRVINVAVKKVIRASEKNIRGLAKASKSEDALKALPQFQAEMDKAAKKGIIHKNTAARHKSRVAKLLAKAAPAPVAA